MGAPAGEGYLFGFTPVFEVPVYELGAAVAVQTAYGHGEGGADVLGGLQRPLAGLVHERPDLRPAKTAETLFPPSVTVSVQA